MLSALYGSLIAILVSSGLTVAVKLIESSYSNSVRHDLTDDEKLILLRANLDQFSDNITEDLKSLDQRL